MTSEGVALTVGLETEETPFEPFYKAAEIGLTCYDLPEQYGGGGLSVRGGRARVSQCRIEANTGRLPGTNGGTLIASYQYMDSDGYRTWSGVSGQNFMLKYQKPVGSSTLLTVFLNYNQNYYYQPDTDRGLTAAQAATFGKNYVLGNDPSLPTYYQYNRADKNTAFNYVGLQSELGGWNIDDKFYYYNYTNLTGSSSGADVLAGLAAVKTATGASIANQMPGYRKVNEYWVAGNTFKGTKQFDAGLAGRHIGVPDQPAARQRGAVRQVAQRAARLGVHRARGDVAREHATQREPFSSQVDRPELS